MTVRPWEAAASTSPLIAAQSPWNRVLTIKRPPGATAIGVNPYQGLLPGTETTVATNVPGIVELASSGKNSSSSGLPSDSAGPIKWTVTIPASAMQSLPTINERDVIYDDLGRRFQVDGFQPSALGAKIDTVRLLA